MKKVLCFLLLLVLSCEVYADGIDSDVVLMLHADGSDGSTSFPDSSFDNVSVSANGNAQVDNAQYKFAESLRLDGSGDYLSSADSDSWNLGDTFTIDLWLRFSEIKNYVWLVGQGGVDSTNFWTFSYDNAGLGFTISVNDSTVFSMFRSWSPSTSVWYHLSLVRDGSSWSIFVDGNKLGSSASSSATFPNLSASLFVGAGTNGSGNYLNGWLDEIRISKGVARWSGNFSPPGSPYSEPEPTPSPSATPSPSPSPTPEIEYSAVAEEKYYYLLSLSGLLCGFVFAIALVFAFRT